MRESRMEMIVEERDCREREILERKEENDKD